MANAIRVLTMDAVELAKSGHPGMPMGMADVATILFSEFLKFDPAHPTWPDRDRFILSAGHGSMLLYSLLYLTGYGDITLEDIKQFRQLGSKTAGHPEYGHLSGVETTTGPLGQGLANAVGMALTEKMLGSRFGSEIVDHYTYVIVGDGCLMEGISHEAISLAGHLNLSKLIMLFDDNRISIDGETDLTVSDDQLVRCSASNWHVQRINGHDQDEIRQALTAAKASNLPSLIACRTVIAYGAPNKSGSASSHGSPLGSQEIAGARQQLGWNYPPFEIPEDCLKSWRLVGENSKKLYEAWQMRTSNSKFEQFCGLELPQEFDQVIAAFKQELADKKPSEATRKSSGNTLEKISGILPQLLGGSADLTGSNDTKTKSQQIISASDFSGSYIHYGVREHAMGAIMNGIALHKGFIPYGGSFLVFTDYCRPAIRLSALMGLRVIYVMTHDSIGLGEDGPTHQPVEHLASLRAIPNLYVYRPADAVEVAECWQLALHNMHAPAILSLTRQAVPTLRQTYVAENLSSKGGYIIAECEGALRVTIFASGSEVTIALEAKEKLQALGFGTRVISMVCTLLFDQQDITYKNSILKNDSIKVAVEAASSFGWERYIGIDGIFVGMNSFGASAPAEDLYKHFKITADEIVTKVRGA
jgi:transketolase